jgi:hypothetical protein
MIESPERHFWTLIEPIHALTYFAPESHQAFEAVGLHGFWRGYFAGRAAPLGAVGPGVVTALFFGFHTDFVRRAVPDIWARCPPEVALHARSAGVDAAWRAHVPATDRPKLRRAAFILRSACEAVAADRRPMFAANADLAWPAEAHLALWQATTVLREHRGDGHVTALDVHGLDPCEAHVLRVAVNDQPVESIKPYRGWSDHDWIDAIGRLAQRDLLDETGRVTPLGTDLHHRVETLTDELARVPIAAIQTELGELTSVLAPIVTALSVSVIPYPNPMGVEPFDAG